MLISPLPPPLIRDDRGFTLVEVLVAMVTGLIVMGALFAILSVSVTQSARISEMAQSTQLGRTTMTRIQDELHSACVSPKFAPVKEGSNEGKLVLVNAYSEKAEVPATWTVREVTEKGVKRQEVEGVRKDEIVFNEGAKTLTDTYSLGTGESVGEYTFGAGKAVKIGENVTKIGATPIFKYYKYATTGTAGAGEASTTLAETKPAAETFTKAEATSIAAVAVAFNTGPASSDTTLKARKEQARTADLTSMTTLAFSAPDAEATITGGPCE
jgi:Tfp pilus assembly protein PilW